MASVIDLVSSTVYPKAQLLASIYGLNRTFTKKILVGLEFDDEKKFFVPIVRLIGNDFVGIAFNPSDWTIFTNTFRHIDEYFSSYTSNYADHQMVGGNFSLRFTTAHNDKAVQIEELLSPAKCDASTNLAPIRKYKRSIVMKKTTFDRLKVIVGCISVRLQYLKNIESSVEFFANELGKHYLQLLCQKQEAQYTTVDIGDILEVSKISEEDFFKIAEKFTTVQPLNINEMKILTEEFLFDHVHYIAFKAQNSIQYM